MKMKQLGPLALWLLAMGLGAVSLASFFEERANLSVSINQSSNQVLTQQEQKVVDQAEEIMDYYMSGSMKRSASLNQLLSDLGIALDQEPLDTLMLQRMVLAIRKEEGDMMTTMMDQTSSTSSDATTGQESLSLLDQVQQTHPSNLEDISLEARDLGVDIDNKTLYGPAVLKDLLAEDNHPGWLSFLEDLDSDLLGPVSRIDLFHDRDRSLYPQEGIVSLKAGMVGPGWLALNMDATMSNQEEEELEAALFMLGNPDKGNLSSSEEWQAISKEEWSGQSSEDFLQAYQEYEMDSLDTDKYPLTGEYFDRMTAN